jgi:hypothetical protein
VPARGTRAHGAAAGSGSGAIDEGVARALGWCGIGLGVAEIAAPRALARAMLMETDRPRRRAATSSSPTSRTDA